MSSTSLYKQAKAKAVKIGEKLNEVSLQRFFEYMHFRYYDEVDISFMGYFLSLYEVEDDYPIEHTALIEYGVMTCTNDSSKIKRKLTELGLEEIKDYNCSTTSASSEKSRGTKTKKVYGLTQDAFKLCLSRAQRRPGQPKDPVNYARYFILLEKIYLLYTVYQKSYKEAKAKADLKRLEEALERSEQARIESDRKHAEVMDMLKESKDIIRELTDEVADANDKADTILGVALETHDKFVKTKKDSTIRPDQEELHHMFVMMKFKPRFAHREDAKFELLAGQAKHVEAKLKSYKGICDPVFGPVLVANGIDMRNNAKNWYAQFASDRAGDSFADMRALRKAIPISFGSVTVKYHNNPYISETDLVDYVKQVYEKTVKAEDFAA